MVEEHQYRYPFLSRAFNGTDLHAGNKRAFALELFFSTAGDIVTQNWACLQPQHMDTLNFLKKKMNYEDRIHATYTELLVFDLPLLLLLIIK